MNWRIMLKILDSDKLSYVKGEICIAKPLHCMVKVMNCWVKIIQLQVDGEV